MAINPQITKNYSSGNIKESVLLVYMGCRASFYMLTLLIVPFVVNIDYVLGLWLGKVPENTSLFLYFILAVSLIYSLSQPVTIAIQATGEIKVFQIWIFVLTIVEVALTNAVLWSTGSLVFALIPSVVVNMLSAAVRIVILRKYVAEYDYRQYFFDVVLRCTVVLVLSYFMALLLHNIIEYDGFWLFLVECLSIAVTTLIVIFILGLKSQERRLVTVKLLDRINHLLRNLI